MTVDWRVELAAARRPSTPAQDAWDATWFPLYAAARRRMSPNRAAVRATDLTEARHGPRPSKETK